MTPHRSTRRRRYGPREHDIGRRPDLDPISSSRSDVYPGEPVDELTLEDIQRRLGLLVTTDDQTPFQ